MLKGYCYTEVIYSPYPPIFNSSIHPSVVNISPGDSVILKAFEMTGIPIPINVIWTLNYVPISGIVQHQLILHDTGIVSFYCSAEGGPQHLRIKYFNSVSIPEMDESKIKVYPNPTIDNFSIEINTSIVSHIIELYDILGNQIFLVKNVSENKFSLDMTEFNKGIYYLIISNEKKIIYLKKLFYY
jgi:hypothetical protein